RRSRRDEEGDRDQCRAGQPRSACALGRRLAWKRETCRKESHAWHPRRGDHLASSPAICPPLHPLYHTRPFAGPPSAGDVRLEPGAFSLDELALEAE